MGWSRPSREQRRRRWRRPHRAVLDERMELDHGDQPLRRRPGHPYLRSDDEGSRCRTDRQRRLTGRPGASAGDGLVQRGQGRRGGVQRDRCARARAVGGRLLGGVSVVLPDQPDGLHAGFGHRPGPEDDPAGGEVADLGGGHRGRDPRRRRAGAGADRAGRTCAGGVPTEAARPGRLPPAEAGARGAREGEGRLMTDAGAEPPPSGGRPAEPEEAIAVREEDAFDTEAVASWLREHSDDVAGLDGVPEVQQFPGGASNLTYLLRYPERDLILRRPPVGAKAKSAHDMHREFTIQSRLRPVFDYVPRMVAFCDDPHVLGSDFYVMERL